MPDVSSSLIDHGLIVLFDVCVKSIPHLSLFASLRLELWNYGASGWPEFCHIQTSVPFYSILVSTYSDSSCSLSPPDIYVIHTS